MHYHYSFIFFCLTTYLTKKQSNFCFSLLFEKIILLPLLVVAVSGDGAPYRFSYEANDEGQHQRQERGL